MIGSLLQNWVLDWRVGYGVEAGECRTEASLSAGLFVSLANMAGGFLENDCWS